MPQPTSDPLSGRIRTIRGQRVMLDADLARLYSVTTKVFNQTIKRNASRFPADFAFQLTTREAFALRSQIVTSNTERHEDEASTSNWSQTMTSSKTKHRGGRRYLPWAFTEHGAVMAANVLKSPRLKPFR